MKPRHAQGIEAVLADPEFDGDVYPDEPMARHTTYRIGGPARYYVQANSIGAVRRIVSTCNWEGVPWAVVGRGSNLLVSDEGFPGVVFTLGRDFRFLHFDEERSVIVSGAAVPLSKVVRETFHRSLAGMEFAVDTPGSLGGALRMNAGTRDEWIGNHVASATVINKDGELEKLLAHDVVWGYRTSSFADDDIIVECELSVEQGDPFYIRGKMEALHKRRKKSQPLNFPSCGSVFRNPEGESVAALIEKAGLKGLAVGGAEVSDVHANFIVNKGNATAHDVVELIERIQTKVHEAYGIELQPEVRFLGFA